MKILLCFGTRPEAIKMAPLCHELKKTDVEFKVCVTAQHRKMLDQVLDFFDVVPDYDLDLMEKNQSLNELSFRILKSIDDVFSDFQPDIVLVHGDTTTSSMIALAAFHRGIKVGHVEAGLRTYDKQSPFPEELNRQLTGRIADFHFAPTKLASDNLKQERVSEESIHITGNTVIDALQIGLTKIAEDFSSPDLELVKSIIRPHKKMILVTGHRRENFGDGFENLCQAIKKLAQNESVQVIYPVHLNPAVQEPVYRILGGLDNVHLIAPVDYPAFIYLMLQCYLIITDSGGIQEEAPALGKPVILTRETTERPEAVSEGTVILTGTDILKIVDACEALFIDEDQYAKISKSVNPYGDGMAAARIVSTLTTNKVYENISYS